MVLYLGVLPNSVNILVVSGIVTVLAYLYRNLHKYEVYYYVLALVVSTLSIVFYSEGVFAYINNGIIGYGLLFTVMFCGVIPNKWQLTRHLKMNRGVFSILSFILITPHAALRVFSVIGSVNLFGIAAYVIMVPLTIISFKVIRKEIEPKDWFTIQKGAYIIYIILFIHLIMVASWLDKVVYAVLLTLYVNNKLIKEFKK
jgi:DMSO/TMAO reductase YedYZ heme-binding membrane subunit